jgi:hypothetical protein
MRKLKSLLCVLALTVAFSLPALAGDIPIGGFTEQQGAAPDGYSWVLIDGLYWLMSNF